MEVCLDLVFVDAMQKINDELTAELFDIEISDEHIEVVIWVKVDPNTFRSNLPLFTVSHHEFIGYPVPPRPSDIQIILRANPETTPTNSKTEIKHSEKDFRRRYDINGYYRS